MENKRYKLIVINNNEFIVEQSNGDNYNVANPQQEIFDMVEEASIEKEWYDLDDELWEKEKKCPNGLENYMNGWASNPAKWTDEDINKICELVLRYYNQLDGPTYHEIKKIVQFQKLPKEIFVELEIAKPSESFAPSMNYVLERQSLLNFYPNNSVKITKVIL